MKTHLLVLCALVVGLAGCASFGSGDTESLLSAAGFRTRTPTTEKQKAIFSSMTPFKLERRNYQGKVLYTYADPKQNLVYIGGETEYQRFQQLGLQQQIAMANLSAAQMNQDAALMWGGWGPWGMWW